MAINNEDASTYKRRQKQLVIRIFYFLDATKTALIYSSWLTILSAPPKRIIQKRIKTHLFHSAICVLELRYIKWKDSFFSTLAKYAENLLICGRYYWDHLARSQQFFHKHLISANTGVYERCSLIILWSTGREPQLHFDIEVKKRCTHQFLPQTVGNINFGRLKLV
jgi:hypothetical protein